MGIEEQIAALEARIQQCIIVASGATEAAELAAQRAELAAQRAELAALGSQQAEVTSLVAAEVATIEAEKAEEAVELAAIEAEVEEEEEDAEGKTNLPDEIPVPGEQENPEPGVPESSDEPIVIRIEEPRREQQRTFFKPNRSRFARGRTGRK